MLLAPTETFFDKLARIRKSSLTGTLSATKQRSCWYDCTVVKDTKSLPAAGDLREIRRLRRSSHPSPWNRVVGGDERCAPRAIRSEGSGFE
jgi:hypothetical protein